MRVIQKTLIALSILFCYSTSILGQDTIVYKNIDSKTSLIMLSLPAKTMISKERPCVVLLSGGGWVDFSWTQLNQVSKPLLDLGARAFVVEYRTSKNYSDATPMDALEDVQDAIFYLRQNASQLNINKDQIIAVGASSGGHLAYASLLANPRNLDDILAYGPNYIVAYSPVLRNDEHGYGADRITADNRWFSPWHVYMESDANIPPSLVFSGTKDQFINIDDLAAIQQKAKEKGDDFTLVPIKGIKHSMQQIDPDIFKKTNPQVLEFLNAHDIYADLATSNSNRLSTAGIAISALLILIVFIGIKKKRSRL